jgi:hypothetical protein
MANKKSQAIELKEMNYPELEEVTEETKTVPQPVNKASAEPPLSPGPAFLTPIVPINSTPPPLSFVEQQRLSAQMPRPEERKEQPVPQRMSMPAQYPMPIQANGYLSVACSTCRGIIQYPPNVPIVYCMQCRVSTATKPLLNIFCQYCRNSSYYVADTPQARCRCGAVYAIRPA